MSKWARQFLPICIRRWLRFSLLYFVRRPSCASVKRCAAGETLLERLSIQNEDEEYHQGPSWTRRLGCAFSSSLHDLCVAGANAKLCAGSAVDLQHRGLSPRVVDRHPSASTGSIFGISEPYPAAYA